MLPSTHASWSSMPDFRPLALYIPLERPVQTQHGQAKDFACPSEILCSVLPRRRHALIGQLLHPGRRLGDIEIALGVGLDVMARAQNSGRLNLAEIIER